MKNWNYLKFEFQNLIKIHRNSGPGKVQCNVVQLDFTFGMLHNESNLVFYFV